MIKRFDTTANPLLSSVIDSIENSLLCPKYKEVTNRIAVHPLVDGTYNIRENKLMAEKGFGNCLIKSYDLTNWYVSIIINTKNCINAKLTEREIAAVVLHELGHILNEPELQVEPTFEYCFVHGIHFNREVLNEVQESNSKTMEIFADSYANKYGYGKELISTFHKQDKNFEQKIGYSSIRIETILKKEYFEGEIISPNKNG